MPSISRKLCANSLCALTALAIGSLALHGEVPKGWLLAGSKPAEYETSVDSGNTYGGQPSAYLRSKTPKVSEPGFGTLMQMFAPDQYIGKRVRYSAFVKSERVDRWAGLWLRVDGKRGQPSLAFDNMQDRPVKGTSGWQNYEVILDVPEGATNVAFGILLDGPGSVWMSGAKVEEVSTSIPSTDKIKPAAKGPTNLGFDK